MAFSASFFYVQIQLQVTATSPAGRVGPHGPGHRPGRPVQQGLRPLHDRHQRLPAQPGQSVVSAVPLTSQPIDLTLSGVTQDGLLTLTIPAGAILDTVRAFRNLAFTGTYIVDIVVGALSHAAPGQDPGGQPDLRPVGHRRDRLRRRHRHLHPAPGRQPDAHACPDDRPEPDRHAHGHRPRRESRSAARPASGAGQTVVLQTVPDDDCRDLLAGRRRVPAARPATTPSRPSSTPSTSRPTDSINSIGTAYDLSSAFASLGTTPAADRAGVLGTIDAAADPRLLQVLPRRRPVRDPGRRPGSNDGPVSPRRSSIRPATSWRCRDGPSLDQPAQLRRRLRRLQAAC